MSARWNRFWFSPAPVLDLAILRILFVGFQVFWLLPLPFTHDTLGQLARHAAMPAEAWTPLPVLQLLMLPFGGGRPSLEFLHVVWAVSLLAGVLGLIGLFTNVALIVFAAGNVLLQAFAYSFVHDVHHREAAMMIALTALALSPCAKVLAIDAWRQRRARGAARPTLDQVLAMKDPMARWPIKLIHLIFVLMYISAVYAKLWAGGLDWANGYTLQYNLATDGMRWGSDFSVWLSQFHWLAVFASWSVLIFQGTFWMTLLFPKLKWIYVPIGMAFHVGIYVTLRAPFWQWMVLYAVFIPWTAALRLWLGRDARSSEAVGVAAE
jgi:hypothetical protein